MKILAVIDVEHGAAMECVRAELTNEIRGSWALFEAGVLREVYATASPTRVVFVLEGEHAGSSLEQLHKLPMVAAGLVRVEIIELPVRQLVDAFCALTFEQRLHRLERQGSAEGASA